MAVTSNMIDGNMIKPELQKPYFIEAFPTGIMILKNLLPTKENKKIVKRSLEIEQTLQSSHHWNCDMYSTLESHSVIGDPDFAKLNSAVQEAINLYVASHGSNRQYEPFEGWVNIGREGAFQEYHDHVQATISCCYYASVPKGAGKLVFRKPFKDTMPITNIVDPSPLTATTMDIMPEERDLIIFRSYMDHMVARGTNTEPRISIAYNA